MWVPSGVIYIVLGLWLLAAWIRQSEQRAKFTELGSQAGQLSHGDRHAA